MESLVLQVFGNPATIDKDSLFLASCIKVCIEWRNYIDTLLSVANFLNLELTSMVEDTSNLHRLHAVVAFELIEVSSLAPKEAALISWGDVLWLLGKSSRSALSFLSLLFATAILILGTLMHEH